MTNQAVDAILSALDFTPDYVCEDTLNECTQAATWLLSVSCGCAPVLCVEHIARSRRVEEMSQGIAIICPRCYVVGVGTVGFVQLEIGG